MTQVYGVEHWRVPNEDTIKVNTYVLLFKTSHCFSYSVVARDHTVELVEALSQCKQGSITPDVTELIDIRDTLNWIKKGLDKCRDRNELSQGHSGNSEFYNYALLFWKGHRWVQRGLDGFKRS